MPLTPNKKGPAGRPAPESKTVKRLPDILRPGPRAEQAADPAAGPTCIDLLARFGKEYRIEEEGRAAPINGRGLEDADPWLLVIRGRHGHVGPWGGSTLAACTDRAGGVARKLARLPFVALQADGADGVTVLFDAADFPAVAGLLKLRRRRRLRLTPVQREAIGRRLSLARRKKARKPTAGAPSEARVRVPKAADGSEAVPGRPARFGPSDGHRGIRNDTPPGR